MESVIRCFFNECLIFEPDSLSDVITEKCSRLSLNNNYPDEKKVENENVLVSYFLYFFKLLDIKLIFLYFLD